MPFVNNGKHVMLNALGAVALRAALYTGDPGADGTANEVTGGSPAYARKTIAWNAASGGEMAKNPSPAVVFDVPACTVRRVGFWNAAATVYYGAELVTEETFGAQGTYTLLDTSKLKIDNPA